MNQVQFVVFLSRFFFFTNCFSCFTYNSENYNHLQVLWRNNLLFLLTSQEMKYSFKEENCGIQSLSLSFSFYYFYLLTTWFSLHVSLIVLGRHVYHLHYPKNYELRSHQSPLLLWFIIVWIEQQQLYSLT